MVILGYPSLLLVQNKMTFIETIQINGHSVSLATRVRGYAAHTEKNEIPYSS